MGERGRDVAHHRFKIVLGVTGEIQESANPGPNTVPSDAAVKDKINKHLKGLDVGNGFKITTINVDAYTKDPIP